MRWLVGAALVALNVTAAEPSPAERYAGHIDAQADGDLNGDGKPDVVLLVQHQPTDDERKTKRYDDHVHDDLLVYLSGPAGLTLAVEKPAWWTAFGNSKKYASMLPTVELSVANEQLVIQVDDPSDENCDERLTFRWDRDALVLVTQEQSQSPRLEYRGLMGRIAVKKTINWATGRVALRCSEHVKPSKTKPQRVLLQDFELAPVDLAEACAVR